MKLELSPQEGKFLAALLKHSLDELQNEVFHTSDSRYKAGLKEDMRLVERLIGELREDVAQPPQVHY